jgi:predicted DNA-binding transcriptional regulator AlpA
MQEKRLLTRPEAMAYLAIRGRSTFERLVKRHKLPRVEFNARTIRYRTSDLDALVRRTVSA